MDRQEIERGHWVERYLAGRLSETERRHFEAYWSENPELIRDLEGGARLKAGLAMLRQDGQLETLVRPAWWPGRFRLLVIAACAALASVGLLTWRNIVSPPAASIADSILSLPDVRGAPLARGDVVVVMRMRGASTTDAVIELPAAPAAIELRVLPEVAPDAASPAATAYDVSLAEESPRRLADDAVVARRIATDADGFVAVFVDSRTLRPARYRLRVEPPGAAGAGVAAAARGAGFVIDVRQPPMALP